ncbi:MAG: LysR substrate-binding domain-containing protein [Glycocaulis sp.]
MAVLPPLNALRAFEAAARRGGFAAAAAELNVTPAAIGQQVRQLEALLGAPLFEREGRSLTLTARGSAALDRLSRAFELMGEASAAMRDSSAASRVVLALPGDLASLWLARRLTGVTGAGVELELVTGDGLAALEAGADLAIIRSADAPAGHDSAPLLREILTPLASPHLAAQISSVDALEGAALIAETGAAPGWDAWLAARGAYGIAARPAITVDDAGLALSLAEAGQGVVLGRRLLAADRIGAGRLVAVFADGDMPGAQTYWLVTPRGRRQSEPARAQAAALRSGMARFMDAADEL